MANATSTQLQELYVAYFGRAADPMGLDYWTRGGITTADFAANMYAQPEFSSFYGSVSVEAQVNQIYLNLFDRQADGAGLSYWSTEILLGNLELAEIAIHLIYAAQNNEGSEDDKTALTNRTEAAEAYTAEISESVDARLAYQPLSNGLGNTEFSAGENINLAKAFLAGIDKDTVFTAETVESSVEAMADNGIPATTNSYTLTDLTDTLTGSSGKDVFQGVVVADLETGTTVTAGDYIYGGGGSKDIFNISVTGKSEASVNITAVNADVEKILFSNFDSAVNDDFDTIYDTSLSNGLTTVGLTSSSATGDTQFTGLQNIVDAEMSSGEADLTVTYVNSAVSGDSDTATLTLSAQTAGTFTEAGGAGGLEILNVVSESAANDVDITSGNHTISTVNISGDQDLTTTVTSNVIETVNASTLTGDLTLTVDEDVDTSVTGGSGDDTVVFSNFDEDDTFDGGAGTDTLSIANAITAASDLDGVSNVEVLEVTGANNVTIADDASVMNFDFSAAASQNLTLNDGVTGAVTVTVGTGVDVIRNTADTTLTIKGTATAINNQTTITGGADATDTIEITADADDGDVIDLVAGGITNVDSIIVIDAGDNTETGEDDSSGKDIKITTGAYATALTIDASALDAATDDDVAATAEVFTLVGTASVASLTVTGGAGDDAITTGTKDDVIDGGAGDDTITSTSGDDNISGGDGDDTFNFGAGLDEDDVVDGGAGTDKLIVTTLEAGNLAGVTNVETLAFNGTATLDADLSFDTLDLTEGDNADTVTFDSSYTNATTVNVDNGDTVVNDADISMSITATAGDLEAGDNTTITGSADAENDSMTITAKSGADIATNGRITNVNSITVVDAGDETDGVDADVQSGSDFSIDLTGYATDLTIDASALDAANKDNNDDDEIASDDASEEKLTITGVSAASLTVTGGSGTDSITASTDIDNLSGGAGDDTFNFAGNLTYLDVVEGGAGTDSIAVSGTQADVNFMKVSGVETVTLDGAATNTLSAYFDASGITTVNLDNDAVSTVVGSGVTNGITYVVNGAQNEDVTAGLGDDFLVVDGLDRLTAADVFDGGTGTDTITLDNSEGAVTAVVDLSKVTNVEKIVVSDADGVDDAADATDAISITVQGVADNGVNNTDVAIEIDASVITDDNDAVTVVASGITDEDYSFTITTGAGADDVTGSGSVDTINTGAEDDTIDAGAGDDVIDAGAGADTIAGGAGADTITGGSGDDTFSITDVTHSTTVDTDVITDFSTGNDELRTTITLDAGNFDFTNKGSAASVFAGQVLLSGVAGQSFFNTATDQLIADSDGNGLIQASDFTVTLTGLTELGDSDVAFDLTVGNDEDRELTTGGGADTFVVAGALTAAAGLDFNAGAGNDVLDINTTDAVNLAAGTLAGFETLDLDATGTNSALTITAAQYNAFDTITAAATDVINVTTMDEVTIAGSTAIDKFTFDAAEDGATISAFTTSGTDVLNLNARAITTDAYNEAAVSSADFGAAGFFVITGDVAGADASMTTAELAGAVTNFDNIGADEMAYLMFKADASAVEDAFIYHVTANDAGAAFETGVLVATLEDVANLTNDSFATANFEITAG